MSDMDEGQVKAVIEFLGSFLTISSQPKELTDLSDGVIMFEALSEISLDHFDPSTIGRDLGDNWALKLSNLRKLVRNLEEFYHDVLQKDADFESISLVIPEIAKNSDPEGIMAIFELIAAAAVTCDDKAVFIERMRDTMEHDSMAELQYILQDVLSRITDYDAENAAGDGDDDADSLVFEGEESRDAMASPTKLFSSHIEGDNSEMNEVVKDRDDLRRQLQDARRELSSLKQNAAIASEDNEKETKRLRALAEDLQDRLKQVQDELHVAEQDVSKKNRVIEEAQTKIRDLEEKNASLADELDVANDKASQLRKSEATVAAYRKKLEDMGAMNQQMVDLEDQTSAYLRQIMELENEVKKAAGLQKSFDELQSQTKKLEARTAEANEALKSKDAEIAKLKSDISASEKAKKMYQDELNELSAQHEAATNGNDLSSPMAGMTLASSTNVAEEKEKLMRLEIENSDLKAKVERLHAQNSSENASVGSGPSADVAGLEKLLSDKNAEVAKLISDKEKLEAYTKKTLQKFQEKYLVALQDCKAKLKEKHDKIEALEQRSANEKISQKREERLLSSAIYELGLGIMQKGMNNR
mmetsp:Transcript_26487/g.54592  ORF Transcript_26487/g.54592 Transcript_26487/m.54592 type:complete len:586 (-) Transcript_26487:96-1853(-)